MKKLKLLLIIPFLIPDFMFAQLASDYYPMHVGDYWIQHTDTTQGEYQPTTFKKDIEGIDLILGEEYFRMRQTRTADDGSSEGTGYAWLRIDSSGVLMGAMGDTSIVDSTTIFDHPLLWLSNEIVNLGYTWEFDAPELGGNFSFKVESISESVQVPAGTFDDCIKIKLIITDTSGDTTQWNYFYFAEGVSEVLNVGWNWHVGNLEYELTEYSVQLSVDEKYSLGIPIHFRLHQNYPNPFNPVTTISYQLPRSGFVNLSIYNVAGQLVETLVNEHKNASYHSVVWNASGIGSGMYFYKIVAAEYAAIRKCLIHK
jgi:hypothetical protein